MEAAGLSIAANEIEVCVRAGLLPYNMTSTNGSAGGEPCDRYPVILLGQVPLAMFELTQGYREFGIVAYSCLQETEFQREKAGYHATRH
jgi:hypothetical protein